MADEAIKITEATTILEDLEKLVEQCTADSETFDGILAGLSVSEEEAIALRYLSFRHESYVPLGKGLGYIVAYESLDDLFTAIKNADLKAYQRRYDRILQLGIRSLDEDYRVQLKLVKDATFQKRVFDIYEKGVWPILQQSVS
ncbi:MAG: hypothetical protein AABY40_00950 [Nanoarchaeota archaeon]